MLAAGRISPRFCHLRVELSDALKIQEILGHASERTTLAIYTHLMRRTHDDSADRIAALAGLSAPVADVGNIRDTTGSVERQESELNACLDGSPGRTQIRNEKAGSFSCFAPSLCADTPKGAPARDWLFVDTPVSSWKVVESLEATGLCH